MSSEPLQGLLSSGTRLPFGRRHRAVVLAWLLMALASPLVAQTYEERVDVRLVQVPVVVWRGAEPVTGLTRNDFELFVNGERQPISSFDVLEFDGAGSEPEEPAYAPERRRLTLLLMDAWNSSPIQIVRALPRITELVGKSSPDDHFAVAVYDGRGVRYLAPFTADRSVVVRAIATLQRSRSHDPLALTITPEERLAHWGPRDPPASAASVEGGFSDDLISGLDNFDETIAAWRGGRAFPSARAAAQRDQEWLRRSAAESWLRVMAAVADDLAPLEGIKQIALFSTGATLGDAGSFTMDRLHESFRRAGATLDIVDLSGLVAPGGASSSGPTQNHEPPDILFRAALGTGGRVIYGTGVATAVRILSETRRVTYVLGFHPPADERTNNDIVVKLLNQPWFTNLSYRTGYSSGGQDPRSVSEMLLADTMLNDIPRDDVTVTIYTDEGGTVEVGIPSDELLAHAIDGFVTVDVYLYVFDDTGNVVRWKHRKMRLDEAKTRAALEGVELVRRERFSLPPGRYAAKALVHIEERELLSFRRKDFEIRAGLDSPGSEKGTEH